MWLLLQHFLCISRYSCVFPALVPTLWQRPNTSASKRGCLGTSWWSWFELVSKTFTATEWDTLSSAGFKCGYPGAALAFPLSHWLSSPSLPAVAAEGQDGWGIQWDWDEGRGESYCPSCWKHGNRKHFSFWPENPWQLPWLGGWGCEMGRNSWRNIWCQVLQWSSSTGRFWGMFLQSSSELQVYGFPSMGCWGWLVFQDQESKCQPLLVPDFRQGTGKTSSFPRLCSQMFKKAHISHSWGRVFSSVHKLLGEEGLCQKQTIWGHLFMAKWKIALTYTGSILCQSVIYI